MIKCTNCGATNPDTRTNCQNCMALLPGPAARSEQGPAPRTNILQDQPALPAWLESLRAGDHPAAPPKNFSQEDMVEEGKVPSWMQSDNVARDDQGSHAYPSMRSAASSAPNTDETYLQGRNISANSLIDENSLPSWMQQPDKSQFQAQSISASSLIQPEYMPEWMKTAQAREQPSTPMPQQRPDVQPLEQGFSAQQLIEPQSLPSWMQAEGGQNVVPPVAPPYNGAPNQNGFSASSLLDMNSMPSWMREGQLPNAPQPQQAQPPAWQAPQQPPMQQRGYEQQPWQVPQQGGSSQAWQTPSQPPQGQNYPSAMPHAQNNDPAQQGGTLSMGSLIDMNSLPTWLRSAAEAQQQGQTDEQQNYPAGNIAGGYGAPPRVDNVRVPSRPRGEIGMNEGSEVAANVFSSMLGVASNAPQFPNQQQPPAFNNRAAQGPMMPLQQTPGMPEVQRNSTNPLGSQNYGQPINYGSGMQSGQGMYTSTPSQMGGPSNQGINQQQAARGNNEKTAKKGGLFEAIRNFFFR